MEVIKEDFTDGHWVLNCYTIPHRLPTTVLETVSLIQIEQVTEVKRITQSHQRVYGQ